MKRRIALLSSIAFSLLFANTGKVCAGDLGYGTEIATSYYKWTTVLGVPGVSKETSYSEKDENGFITLCIDDLAILYDAATLEADQVILFFSNGNDDMSHQIMKMNALVAAIEYNEYLPPEDWRYYKAGSVLEKTIPVFQDLCAVLEEDHYKLLSGDYICFHEGEKCEYVVGYDLEYEYVVVAQ